MHFVWFLVLALSTHAFEKQTFRDVHYDLQKIDLQTHELRQYWKDTNGVAFARVADLRKFLRSQKKAPTLIANSGIYDTSFRPLGLYIEDGRQLRKINLSNGSGGNFGLRPNGVFALTKLGGRTSAQIVESTKFRAAESIVQAAQSGPMLVIDSEIHPKFTQGSLNTKIRNGVGVDREGKVVFAISREPVSFYDFADFFRSKLGCPNALYLDGTISMMIDERTPDTEAEAQIVPFVGMWAAWQR